MDDSFVSPVFSASGTVAVSGVSRKRQAYIVPDTEFVGAVPGRNADHTDSQFYTGSQLRKIGEYSALYSDHRICAYDLQWLLGAELVPLGLLADDESPAAAQTIGKTRVTKQSHGFFVTRYRPEGRH